MIGFLFVIPTLNSSHLLKKLINSLNKQTYPYWRVLFVDGFSNKLHRDNLIEFCQSNDKLNWTLEDKNNRGVFNAMNIGFIDVRKNEWMIFWGSDDWAYNENILKNLAYEIKEFKNKSDLIVCKARYFNTKTKRMARESFFIKNSQTKIISRTYFKFLLFLGLTPPHQSTLFSSKVVDKMNYYSNKFQIAADLDYFLRLSGKEGIKISIIDQKIVLMSTGGLSSIKWRKKLSEVYLAYKNTFGIFFIIPLALRYLRKISIKCFNL
tara:strand:+ start:27636 stop:28430 length:795 start_codon:yes stop_codon:yes gene_type:complete